MVQYGCPGVDSAGDNPWPINGIFQVYPVYICVLNLLENVVPSRDSFSWRILVTLLLAGLSLRTLAFYRKLLKTLNRITRNPQAFFSDS